jgi:hypothetical protein
MTWLLNAGGLRHFSAGALGIMITCQMRKCLSTSPGVNATPRLAAQRCEERVRESRRIFQRTQARGAEATYSALKKQEAHRTQKLSAVSSAADKRPSS